ncbi:MAG: flagellin [Succinivibrionaceae bacterium]
MNNKAILFAQRYIAQANNSLNTSYQRLASGKRINSAKDDAAGMQIAHRMTSEINGLTQGNRNAQDGISLAQTAEGALDEVGNMLQRVRTLALQSANGTNSSVDRVAINAEAHELFKEINRIAKDTTYAGQHILDGSRGVVQIQVGAYANQTIDFDLSEGCSVRDLAKAAGGGAATLWDNDDADFDLTTAENSQNVLGAIDGLISQVSKKRATLGAVQNRMESTIRYQSNTIANLSDARSRIEDTDYATEVSNMIQANIQLQAATAVLSQAQQHSNIILSLIKSALGN